MDKEWKAKLIRIIICAMLLVAAMLVEKYIPMKTWQLLLIYLVPYFGAGYDVLLESVEHIRHGQIFDEDFLMSVATIGALVIGFLPNMDNSFSEAVFVMLFFQVGELFEEAAEGRSRRSIQELMDIRPDTANLEKDGDVVAVSPEDVQIGDIIFIKPGEKVPMDGIILEGTSSLNTVALTGESLPRDVQEEDDVLAGCVNLSGVLRVRVTKSFGDSTASRILDLVENARENKSRSENFITKFAKVYTPAVVFSAAALAFIPPLILGNFSAVFPIWLSRALIFLVVSCPCAFVISVPLSFFNGIGGMSRKGILVKGSNYIEALSRTSTIVFDKTGTLTQGVFIVTAVHPDLCSENHLLHLAAHVERFSTHPIAQSLREAYPNVADDCSVEDIEEISGQGIRAVVNEQTVCVGNAKMMEAVGAAWKPCQHAGTIVHVSIDGVYAGHIVIADKLKPDAAKAISELKAVGVKKTVMLTGDSEAVAKEVADSVHLDEYHAGLLPADKVCRVEALLAEQKENENLAFVGDGINDAPVLMRADIGIAMGALGSDAAIEAADVVLMDDKPSKIALAIRASRKTMKIARENTTFAIVVKVGILILAAMGIAPMWIAVFGDVGVMIIDVLNATRALNI